jgi:hypothetical protein
VRRLLAWIGGAAGGFALYRFFARRPQSASPAVDTRAEELRAKLAESRAIVEERDVDEENELTVDAAEPLHDPDDRRRAVHERGRAAADEMRRQPGE